jgi:hypothetical protein
MRLGHRGFGPCIGLLLKVTYKKPVAGLAERTDGTSDSLKWVDRTVGVDHMAVSADVQVQVSGQKTAGLLPCLLRFATDARPRRPSLSLKVSAQSNETSPHDRPVPFTRGLGADVIFGQAGRD